MHEPSQRPRAEEAIDPRGEPNASVLWNGYFMNIYFYIYIYNIHRLVFTSALAGGGWSENIFFLTERMVNAETL